MAARTVATSWPRAAALATLDVIEVGGTRGQRPRQGEKLLTGLRAAATGVAGVADVRGRGLMLAIEFAEPGPDLQAACPSRQKPCCTRPSSESCCC